MYFIEISHPTTASRSAAFSGWFVNRRIRNHVHKRQRYGHGLAGGQHWGGHEREIGPSWIGPCTRGVIQQTERMHRPSQSFSDAHAISNQVVDGTYAPLGVITTAASQRYSPDQQAHPQTPGPSPLTRRHPHPRPPGKQRKCPYLPPRSTLETCRRSCAPG